MWQKVVELEHLKLGRWASLLDRLPEGLLLWPPLFPPRPRPWLARRRGPGVFLLEALVVLLLAALGARRVYQVFLLHQVSVPLHQLLMGQVRLLAPFSLPLLEASPR